MENTPPHRSTQKELLIMGALSTAALAVIVAFGFSLRAPAELDILNELAQEDILETYAIDPSSGSPQAKITIVEFADFGCEHCAQSTQITKKILKAYPKDVRIVWKGVSGSSSESYPMHRAALCAHLQGRFWEYHDLLFDNQATKKTNAVFNTFASQIGLDVNAFNQCLSTNTEIDQLMNRNALMAGSLNITDLPTFFINNTYRVAGVVSEETWKKEIDSLMR